MSDSASRARFLSLWILTNLLCIATGIASVRYHWWDQSFQMGGVVVSVAFYPPLVLTTLWTLAAGFWWGFVPAYLSTFALALYAAMPVGWAALFAFADPIGLAVYAMSYRAFSFSLNLRTLRGMLFFLLVSFAAGVTGSAGCFIWVYTAHVPQQEVYATWQGWWFGAFIQSVLLVTPLLLIWGSRLEKYRHRRQVTSLQPPPYRNIVIGGGLITAGVLLYLHLMTFLSIQHWQLAAQAGAAIGLSMVSSMQAMYSVIVVLILFGSYFFYSLFLKMVRQARQLTEANAKLELLATRDQMTGLLNRHRFMELGGTELGRAQRSGYPTSAIMFDIDHFKQVNDTWGHAVGDRMLALVARTLTKHVRRADLVGRYGGEEISLLLPETALDEAHELAERLRQEVARQSISVDGQTLNVTISGGVAERSYPEENLESLLNRADGALYLAKRNGRNQVVTAHGPLAAAS